MINICTLIDEATNDLKIKAKEKKLKVEWVCPAQMPQVYCDQEKMHHVIYNFIDNALKYSEKGVVRVTLEEQGGGAVFRVHDQGIGFEKSDENNFFQKFYRGDNVRTIGIDGTGLGLYVCRKFVEAHSGRVWARSEGLGKGSEFGFWVPLGAAVQTAVPSAGFSNAKM
jgi:signal transduction histidine kinase